MLDINIVDASLTIKNINKDSIEKIYSVYRNSVDFKYATGIFNTIYYNQFSQQVSQFILRKNVFFMDVFLSISGEHIGLVKGSIIEKDKIAWINSLVISKQHQLNGYGNRVVLLLENYLKNEYDVEIIYLSVYKSNSVGVNFWNKCGYKICDNISNEILTNFNRTVLFMCKKL